MLILFELVLKYSYAISTTAPITPATRVDEMSGAFMFHCQPGPEVLTAPGFTPEVADVSEVEDR